MRGLSSQRGRAKGAAEPAAAAAAAAALGGVGGGAAAAGGLLAPKAPLVAAAAAAAAAAEEEAAAAEAEAALFSARCTGLPLLPCALSPSVRCTSFTSPRGSTVATHSGSTTIVLFLSNRIAGPPTVHPWGSSSRRWRGVSTLPKPEK
jgi:hypothetical protein